MASYNSRRCNVDDQGNLQLRETEEETERNKRNACARKALAAGQRRLATMSTGGWRTVGDKSMHVFPRGTLIGRQFDSRTDIVVGVVTENRMVEVRNNKFERWYTITYEDYEEEDLDDSEVEGALVG